METENRPTVGLKESEVFPGQYRVMLRDGSPTTMLSVAELQELVQAAYDDLGLLAVPSFDAEATRTIESVRADQAGAA